MEPMSKPRVYKTVRLVSIVGYGIAHNNEVLDQIEDVQGDYRRVSFNATRKRPSYAPRTLNSTA